MYKSRYFKIEELVSPQLLEVMGEAMAWRLFPQQILMDLDILRSAYGKPIMINGNGFTNSGVRAYNCDVGAKESRHKLTVENICAFDCKVSDIKKFTDLIITKHSDYGIIRMESIEYTPTWRHLEFYAGIQLPKFTIFTP